MIYRTCTGNQLQIDLTRRDDGIMVTIKRYCNQTCNFVRFASQVKPDDAAANALVYAYFETVEGLSREKVTCQDKPGSKT